MQIDDRYILEYLPMGIYFTDLNRKIIYWNHHAEKITGYPSNEVVGLHCWDNILAHVDKRGENICTGPCPLLQTISDGIPRQEIVYLRHKKGFRKTARAYTFPLRDKEGEIIGAVEGFLDISEFSAMQTRAKELEKIAYFDVLTNLPNRQHLESELMTHLEELKRYGNQFAVLFIDIDHFKQFNDTYGHEAGDQVLQTVAATFQSTSRPFDIFGRWGGEEFVGIIKNVDKKSIFSIGHRYKRLIRKSYINLQDKQIGITVSIGATLAKPEDSVLSVIDRADRLMYISKRNGRNCLTTD